MHRAVTGRYGDFLGGVVTLHVKLLHCLSHNPVNGFARGLRAVPGFKDAEVGKSGVVKSNHGHHGSLRSRLIDSMLHILSLTAREYVTYFLSADLRAGLLDDFENCLLPLPPTRERVRTN
ncbi:hypothetical protein BMEI0538 [Brucella melitensis bv. 1 str. 16M]|uniref:Uncharacterized protein n=1 Tax=Brucella melitensis biotype 1 (strain ATCC 23456 / CCUG 17765 / NCTC 10094 / 16M) TaxID=224914 RepID=Q8YIA7_BRUME|nr:hypothetical protein BMEI0538 [Brucella melitensis bv. 1 str. 16M]